MRWECPETVTTFPVIETALPFRRKTRSDLAKTMTFHDILLTSTPEEDYAEQRRLRWKYLRNFYLVTSKPPFNAGSFDNALFAHAHSVMTLEQFVMRVMLEFKFPNKMKMDGHLSWLYLSFDHHRSNEVDWRTILISYKILTFFRFVRDRPLDLLLLLFDVYGEGESSGATSTDRDHLVLHQATERLFVLFSSVCISDNDISAMTAQLEALFEYLTDRGGNYVQRRELQKLCKEGAIGHGAVRLWSKMAWDRLLGDQRLTILDEAQVHHLENAEAIISRFQSQQAYVIFRKNSLRATFRGWKTVTVKASGARAFAQARLRQRALRWLQKWRRISRRYALYRRRRVLAQVMGDYALKARCFRRISLHNTLIRRVTRIVGSLDTHAKQLTLAATHLREFRRLFDLRGGFQRWHRQIVTWQQHETAARHYLLHLLRRPFVPWRHLAHTHAVEIRQEAVVRENQIALQRMLQETEEAAQELVRIEQARQLARDLEDKAAAQRDKEARLQAAKRAAQLEKDKEQRLLLREQANQRTLRIQSDLKRLKTLFHIDFEFKAQEMLERTKERCVAYIENPENKLAIDLKFETLKREFHANPAPETKEREKMLASFKNILFLFIDAQLKRDKIELDDLFKRFDATSKGYLTYGEFGTMIRSLNTRMNEAQISNVIRHVDADRDGYITLAECLACMQQVHLMGAPGSSWKLYVDPAEDVICYHNFDTNEKFLEYEITDKVLRGINLANIYAEAEYTAQQELKTMRREEWQDVLRQYMARRLQGMYRLWKGRAMRKRLRWKLLQREQAARTKQQRLLVECIVRRFRGRRARRLFERQLALTIEKVWDRDSRRVFYYNHQTQVSTWDAPRLLRIQQNNLGAFYAAHISEPCVWLPVDTSSDASSSDATSAVVTSMDASNSEDMDIAYQYSDVTALSISSSDAVVAVESNFGTALTAPSATAAAAASSSSSAGAVVSYYHVNARRAFPGKPDGFALCSTCRYQLAVRHCVDCAAHYCFACHRNVHANPFGFHQFAKAKRSQYSDPDFVSQLYAFQHVWTQSEPLRCQMCQGRERLFAAWHCVDCGDQDMCRKCFLRLHATNTTQQRSHRYWNV